MHEVKKISSVQNPLIKQLLQLKDKARERKKSGLFVLEGRRELHMAVKGNYAIHTLLFCEPIASENDLEQLSNLVGTDATLIKITKEVYQKIAYRSTTEGIIALVKSKSHALNELVLKTKNPLILVAEAPEKPGNIGALLRTADAANIDAVLIANAKGDLYNPNTIRSSVGCLFTNTIGVGSTAAVIDFLKTKQLSIFCAALTASKTYTSQNFTGPTAIVVGTESSGLR